MIRMATLFLAWSILGLGLLLLVTRQEGGVGPVLGAVREPSRLLVFAAEPEAIFPLDGSESRVKLVTWLSSTSQLLEDPRQTSLFRIDAEARAADGSVVRRWSVWRRARQGLEPLPDGRFRAAAVTPDEPGVLSDYQVTQLDLEGAASKVRSLSVRATAIAEGGRLLVVAFHERARSNTSQERIHRGGARGVTEEIAARVSPWDWEELPLEWREHAVARYWERLAARAPDGRDLPSIRLETAWYRSSEDDLPVHGVPVPPGGAVAFNLEAGEAPTTFQAEWRALDGSWLRRDRVVSTELRLVHEDGTVAGQTIARAGGIGPLTLKDDLVSIQIALSPSEPRPLLLRAWTEGGALDRVWGDPPRAPISDRGQQRLAPDLRALLLHRVGPEDNQSPLVYAVESPEEVFRFSFRVRMPPAVLPGFLGETLRWSGAAPTVRLTAVDEAGRFLRSWEAVLEPVASIFERYSQADSYRTAVAAEPELRYFVPPPGTGAVEVRSSTLTDVSVRVRRQGEVERQAYRDYELPEGARVIGRYAPWTRDEWEAHTPENLDDLALAGREVRLDATVRFESRDRELATAWALPSELAVLGGGDEDRHAPRRRVEHSLELRGPFHLLSEPDPDDRAGSNSRVRLGQGSARVLIPKSGRLRIDMLTPRSEVGRAALLRVGTDTRELTIPASAGQLRIEGLPPGESRVELSGVNGLFLALATGRPLWRNWRVWRVGANDTLTVPVPAGPGALTLYAWAEREAVPEDGEVGQLSWSLRRGDGVAPGVFQLISDTEGSAKLRRWTGRAEGWPISRAGDPLVPLRPVRVDLGEEGAVSGALTFRFEGDTGPLVVRLTSTWARPEPPASSHGRLGAGP